jgi:hypothetical protein
MEPFGGTEAQDGMIFCPRHRDIQQSHVFLSVGLLSQCVKGRVLIEINEGFVFALFICLDGQ